MPLSNIYTPVWVDVPEDWVHPDDGGDADVEDGSAAGGKKRPRPGSSSADSPPPPPVPPRKLRPLKVDMSLLSAATGSALVCLGETKVLVGVFAPLPLSAGGSATMDAGAAMERGQLTVDVQYIPGNVPLSGLVEAPVSVGASRQLDGAFGSGGGRSLSDRASCMERDPALASMAGNALRPVVRLAELPKCVVQVQAVVLQAAGSELSAVVCAAALALADAGVPMNGLVAACAVAAVAVEEEDLANKSKSAKNGAAGDGAASSSSGLLPPIANAAPEEEVARELVLDPSRDEELASCGQVTVAILSTDSGDGAAEDAHASNDAGSSSSNSSSEGGEPTPQTEQMVQFKQEGRFKGADMEDAFELARRGCSGLITAMKAALIDAATAASASPAAASSSASSSSFASDAEAAAAVAASTWKFSATA